jgi:IS30 family transposase
VARRRMLTDADREEISRGIAADEEQEQLAARIGRDPSVVCREIARHGGRVGYRAAAAGRAARRARSRPKARKLDACPAPRERVTALLKASCPPGQAAGRLRYLAGGSHAESVSAEAIYTWIYALPKGELARQGICCGPGGPSAARAAGRRHRAPGSWA